MDILSPGYFGLAIGGFILVLSTCIGVVILYGIRTLAKMHIADSKKLVMKQSQMMLWQMKQANIEHEDFLVSKFNAVADGNQNQMTEAPRPGENGQRNQGANQQQRGGVGRHGSNINQNDMLGANGGLSQSQVEMQQMQQKFMMQMMQDMMKN